MVDKDGRDPHEGLDEGAVANAVAKLVAIAAVIGLVIGGGIFLVVSALGVGDDTSAVADLPDASSTRSPLPTVALSPSGEGSGSASASPSESSSPTESESPEGKLTLSSAQSQVAPGERIDLTGQYAGKDGTVLQVQRRAGGSWQPFADVTARVQGGSFSTYVITSQNGEQRFRVFDEGASTGSNPVVVTVGG